jgi:hypothetical protein
MTIQGNQSVEINALNHNDSNITSDRDITFRSPVRLLSNGNYKVGGYFTTEDLNQNVIDFIIPHNNVIKANGDVTLSDYTGSSLYILASGKVTLGNVTIDNPEDNQSITQDISDGKGGNQTITINSKNDVGILDVRAGIDENKIQGVLENNPNSPTNPDLIIGDIINNGGNVLLTNQYKPNYNLGKQSANITVGNIYTYFVGGKNGGAIALTTNNGSINAQFLSSSSLSFSGNTGNGGAIALNANNGNINAQFLNSISYSASGNGGNGGAIALNANNGNINAQFLYSSSLSFSGSGGDGGAIALKANNIATDFLWSNSSNGNGGAININAVDNIQVKNINSEAAGLGNGGNITAISNNGSINTTGGLVTSQITDNSGGSGKGGTISFTAKNDITTDLLNSGAETGNAGAIQLTSTNGNIKINNTLYSDSIKGNGGNITLNNSNGNITTGTLNSGNAYYSGNGGNIEINNSHGNIKTADLYSGARLGNGGNITFNNSNGNISTKTLDSDSYSGNGENITLNNSNGNITTEYLFSPSISGNGGNIALNNNNGNITETYTPTQLI